MELRRVQAVVVAILLLLPVAGHRKSSWPVINWTMYGQRTTPMPGPVRSRLCVRVVGPAAEVRTRLPSEIVPRERIDLLGRIIDRAFSSEASPIRERLRSVLVRLLRDLGPGFPIERVELVRRDWAVEPLALPPVDRAQPRSEERLAGFAAAAYLGAGGRAP